MRMRNQRLKYRRLILYLSMGLAILLVLFLGVVKVRSFIKEMKEQENRSNMALQPVETSPVETTPVETPPPTPNPKAVALTFDDGPSRDNDPGILEVLKANNAHATFFVQGIRARVDGDIMQQILDAGCEIGNHSWNHPDLSKLKWNKVKKQIEDTKDVLKKENNYEIQLLRPPYGAISNKMRKNLKMPMILWSLDTLDWKLKNPEKIYKKVKKEVKDGDIILLHDIHDFSAKSVEQIVPFLKQNGYDVLTVSELFERNGKKFKDGVAYTDGLNE